MTQLKNLLESIPAYAKDIKLNISNILVNSDAHLSSPQVAGVLYASALATKQATLIKATAEYAEEILDAAQIQAVKAAAAIMAMNNIYYRFTHLVSDSVYAEMPARLRMNVLANPGVDKVDFELYAMALSIINGCGMCMDAHSKSLAQHGMTKEGVQACARIAAIINAFAQVLVIEEAH